MPERFDAASMLGARSSSLIGRIWESLRMSGGKIDRRAAQEDATAKKDDELITRAAKRTDWAGTALESAAGDLDDAHGVEGKPLTNLAEVVQDEATRVSHLAEDIKSHRPLSEDDEPGDGV
jgi:hypothetical protein